MKNEALEHWSSPNGCHPDCPACEFDMEEPTPNEVLTELSGVLHRIPLAHREIIIRAVDSHEALLKLARGYWQFLRTMPRSAETVVTKMHVENVIAKAEGKIK